MVAGDNAQLDPIMRYSWKTEDRPPIVEFVPFLSAYDTISRRGEDLDDDIINTIPLTVTHRLPPLACHLINKGNLWPDDLRCFPRPLDPLIQNQSTEATLEELWSFETEDNPFSGIYLIVHNEENSSGSNPVEVQIVQNLVNARPGGLDDRLQILTPRTLQQRAFQTPNIRATWPDGKQIPRRPMDRCDCFRNQ